MKRFQDRTVVITGASRGLGQAIALGFGAEGAHVYVGHRTRQSDAEATAEAIREAGGSGAPLQFDVRDRKAVEAAFGRVIAERGAIDVLVNNAALSRDTFFPMMSAEAWDDVLATNLSGVFHCCRAVVRHMVSRGAGAIVNVGSVAGLHASPGQANYAASKGGLLALTRTLAAELAPRGIRVNAVVPGLLATGMVVRMDRRIVERKRKMIPLGRLGTAEEVSQAVLFLASDQAGYVIGQALVVDGGLTL